MTKESVEFENKAREFLSEKWSKPLKERTIKIGNFNKKFDLVSEDHSIIGDAKYYKRTKGNNSPSAKLSIIGEYVWLLEKTTASKKFLVFGQDIRVPKEWLKRFGSLTSVAFYFFENNKLILLA